MKLIELGDNLRMQQTTALSRLNLDSPHVHDAPCAYTFRICATTYMNSDSLPTPPIPIATLPHLGKPHEVFYSFQLRISTSTEVLYSLEEHLSFTV